MPALHRRDLLKTALPGALLLAMAGSALADTTCRDQRFTVTTLGEGREVILIPGLGGSPEIWREATGHLLRRGFRVRLIQVAGFAGAPAGANARGPILDPLTEALGDYLRREGIERPAIVGHGLGAQVAMTLAARRPEAVGRVMAVDALPYIGLQFFGPEATVERARPHADAILAEALARSPQAYARAEAEHAGALVRLEAARPALIDQALRTDRAVAARAMHELMLSDLRPELSALRCPVHTVYAFDAEVHEPDAQALDRLYRDAYAPLRDLTLSRIDDSRHYLMLDQPAHFAARLDAFLA